MEENETLGNKYSGEEVSERQSSEEKLSQKKKH